MAFNIPWWLVLIFLKHSTKAPPNSFSYSNTEKWKESFPMCGGPMQSPIELRPSRLAFTRTPKLKFASGLNDGQIEATNTGRELKLKLRPRNRDEPLVQLVTYNKPTMGVYTFAQMHFHWGSGGHRHGSEHCVGKNYTDAEAHFVFFNSRYRSFKEAVRHFDGLLVIGVMLHAANDDIHYHFPTLGIEDSLPSISSPGETLVRDIDLSDYKTLLQRAVSKFYSYHGSLTTPPCNPVVSWMVAAKPVDIGEEFLGHLRTEIFEDEEHNHPLVNNCRPVQNNYGRVVTQHYSIG